MAVISGAEPSYTEIPLAPHIPDHDILYGFTYTHTYALAFISQANYIYHR